MPMIPNTFTQRGVPGGVGEEVGGRGQKKRPRRCMDWRSQPSICAAQSVLSTVA
jgi:hypothetical protein